MAEIKRAVIIAAGEGKRLRPVTLEVPKPLIKVNGKRMIDTGIEALRASGVRDIYIVVGYKKELFYEKSGKNFSFLFYRSIGNRKLRAQKNT